MIGSSLKGSLKIDLLPLKDHCEISNTFAIILESKGIVCNIDMRIAIKKAISIPEMLSRETLKIKRIYPEFKVNEEQKLPVENDNTKSEAKKVVINKEKQVKNEKPIVIDYPNLYDDYSNYSFEVVIDEIIKINDIISKKNGRVFEGIKERLEKLNLRKNFLLKMLKDPNNHLQYIEMMRKELERNYILLNKYRNDYNFIQCSIVNDRIVLLIREIQEYETKKENNCI